MEREDLYQLILFFLSYSYSFTADVIFAGAIKENPYIGPYVQVSKVGAFFAVIISMIIIEWACQVAASKYFAIKLIVRPQNRIIYLFVNRSGVSKDTSDIGMPGWRVTTLPLGVKIRYEPYGEVKAVFFRHQGSFDDRMVPGTGKIPYKGNTVDHNSLCIATAYEIEEGQFAVDHGEPQPSFLLVEAPGDFELGPMSTMPIVSGNPRSGALQVQYLANRTRKLESAVSMARRNASYWHTTAIAFESAIKGLQEELNGVLKNPLKHMVSVIQYVQHYVTAIGDIEQLAKQSSIWKRIPTQVIYAIIGGGIVIFALSRPELAQGIGDFFQSGSNQLFVLIGLVVVVAGLYYFLKARRK